MIRLHRTALPCIAALAACTGVDAAAACECAATLDHVAGYVERNYAGFRDKVPSARRGEYDALRTRLAETASRAADDTACDEVIAEYIAFFGDRHLAVGRSMSDAAQPESDDAVRARFASWPARTVGEEEYRVRLSNRQPAGDALDGIWEIVGADYRMAMVPADSDTWEAVILQADGVWWTEGQVKGRFRRVGSGRFEVVTYLRDHTPVREMATLVDGVLAFESGSPWARTWPDNPSGYDRERWAASANRASRVIDLDENAVLIQLPTFDGREAERIDSLVAAHWERLTSAPHLIIDVRGNGGGATRSFHGLLPLLYTRPIISTGLALYATEDNLAALAGVLADGSIPADQRARVDSMLAQARVRIGEFVAERPDTFRFGSVLAYPQRVAVVTDRFCASSCEAFVKAAQQSDKVTVYGSNTGGLLDYGNVIPVPTSCPSLLLYNPTSRSNHLSETSYDLVGIPPDVSLPPGVVYPLEWVHGQLRAAR